MRSECIRPVFASGDHVVIRWNFDLRAKDDTRLFRDELAYQRWQGGKIVEVRPSRSKPDIGSIRTENTVTNQDDQVVMRYTSIVLMRRRPQPD